MHVILLVALLFPSVAFAAYQDPVVISKEPTGDGGMKIVLDFAGNAGEPTARKAYIINSSTTATILRNWVYTTKQELDKVYAAATLPALAKGATIAALAPAAPAAPTALDLWVAKAVKAQQMKELVDAGVTALSSELTTLLSDVNSTYPGGF